MYSIKRFFPKQVLQLWISWNDESAVSSRLFDIILFYDVSPFPIW